MALPTALQTSNTRLTQQLEFLIELDALKQVLRRTITLDGSRRENTAEHSWHISMMALLLAEYAAEEIDVVRAVKLLMVHDIVEIDAGDTYAYDESGNEDKEEREQKAADRLFGLLPEDQGNELRQLWDEFEARSTPESRYANAVDRLQPMLLNYLTGGKSWLEHDISRSQVIGRNSPIGEGAPKLWELTLQFIDDAVERDLLKPD